MSGWRLNEGVLLEDQAVLVPWLTPWNELPNFGQPQARAFDRTISFSWTTRLFSGLSATLEADLLMEPSTEIAIYSDHLRYARASLTEAFSAERDARETYHYLRDRLASTLGAGTDRMEHGLPETRWRIGEGRLSTGVSDRMGEYVTLAMWHSSMDVFWP
jgi:hypothetical protein